MIFFKKLIIIQNVLEHKSELLGCPVTPCEILEGGSVKEQVEQIREKTEKEDQQSGPEVHTASKTLCDAKQGVEWIESDTSLPRFLLSELGVICPYCLL